ncbi:hypothetical protein [Lewinella sp. LCG006]|uniref:hypothetical protein n=1 Tax=Lewinella sp. LCG006 TaxID=3231911 RepID=UPI003460EE92
MKNQTYILFQGLCLLAISTCFFQCNDDDAAIVFDNCLIEELIDSPYIQGDTTLYLSPDTFTHIIENERILQRLKNHQPYEEFISDENGLVMCLRRFSQGSWFSLDSFFYENQKLVAKRRYNKQGEIIRSQDFHWEGDQLKSGYAISFTIVNGQVQRNDDKFDFEYTGENITEYKRTIYLGNGDTLFTKTTFAYDNNENFLNYLTFKPLDFIMDFSLWQAPYWFSSNNVTLETGYNVFDQIDQWSREKMYTYTWENGMVADFTYTFQTNVGSDLFVQPVKVYYECW